jgi:hypothetical protein
LVRRELRSAEKGFHGIRGNDAVLTKRRLVNLAGAGHASGVRHSGECPAFGLANFEHNDLFTDLMGPARRV